MVTVPGHGDDKINAAFALGENEQEGDGPALLSETISYNFNIPINYFVTIDFAGFRDVVDTIGGIVVDVPAPIKDDQYPTENFGLTRAYFPAGPQEMDGETALRYARTRHGDNDIARGERQQQVLLAIRQQAVSRDLIRNADSLIRQFGDSVRTDLDFNQMLALANLGRGIDPQAITRVNLWERGVLSEHLSQSDDDPYYMEVDGSMMRDLVAQYFPTKTPAAQTQSPTSATASGTPEGTTTTLTGNLNTPLIVQDNSSDNTGGATAMQMLTKAGFTAITQEMGADVSQTTTIYDYVNDPDTATLVAQKLGLDPSAVVPGNGGTGILIVVGDDLTGQ
jgi:LCP family protein required for cell wall assembly